MVLGSLIREMDLYTQASKMKPKDNETKESTPIKIQRENKKNGIQLHFM